MNLKNMLEGSALAEKRPQIKRIFFYRICGTGMGACACLAKEAGFEVAGADVTFSPPMSTYLESSGIPLLKLTDVTKETLSEYDLIIVGNVVAKTSDNAREIEECGVPFTSFPAFLGEFILKDKTVIGLSGTHGKTTTTYFLTQMLENLGESPGYFIGGIIDGRPPSKLGKGKYFAIESDEYDSAYFQKISKFRLYEINHLIITSLEFDHADIFDSIEDIKDEFAHALNKINGSIIYNDEYRAIEELKEKFDKTNTWIEYGKTSEHGPKNIKRSNNKTTFELKFSDKVETFETNVVGEHNILNISSCVFLLLKEGFAVDAIKGAVAELGLVKRRQEYRGIFKGSVVIDDFAHHPRAIDLTIDAIKQAYPSKKIVTVFEPISATARSQIFQKEFETSLLKSDEVILAANELKTTVAGGTNLDCNLISKNLNSKNIKAHAVNNLDQLLNSLEKASGEDKLLLILSNKTCLGLWESEFVSKLS